jgi:membrane protein YdbS with pleckstrin-like domain
MNQPSVFQAQYPLSPRKFWKKVISKIFVVLLISLFFSFFAILFPIILYNSQNGNTGIVPIIVMGFFVVFIIIMALYAWYIKAYIRRYYYDCGDQFITIKKGVFAPTEIHVQYQKIQDVYVDQDLLDRIMGLYDVHIASATVTSGIEAHIDGVNADIAEALKNIILGKIHGASNLPLQPQAPMSQPQSPQPNPVQFSQKISSETYPISGAWIVSMLGSSLFFSLIYSLILLRFLFLISPVYWFFVFGFIFFAHVIWQSVWKSNFYFEFTPDYILFRTGVISRSENHLPYKSIQNILNKQSILSRILGLSTVVIQNAAQQMMGSRGQVGQGSAISLVWQPKEKAEELNNILNDIVSKINPQNSSNMMGL